MLLISGLELLRIRRVTQYPAGGRSRTDQQPLEAARHRGVRTSDSHSGRRNRISTLVFAVLCPLLRLARCISAVPNIKRGLITAALMKTR